MKKSLFLLLLLAMGFATSCNKDEGTSQDVSAVIGEWYCTGIEFYYDGEQILGSVPKNHIYFLSGNSISYFGPENFEEDGYIINADGSAYYCNYLWSDDGIVDDTLSYWDFQDGTIVFDGEIDNVLKLSGTNLLDDYSTDCSGYYISNHYIEDYSNSSPEDITTDWSGRDGQIHELKVVYTYSKR